MKRPHFRFLYTNAASLVEVPSSGDELRWALTVLPEGTWHRGNPLPVKPSSCSTFLTKHSGKGWVEKKLLAKSPERMHLHNTEILCRQARVRSEHTCLNCQPGNTLGNRKGGAILLSVTPARRRGRAGEGEALCRLLLRGCGGPWRRQKRRLPLSAPFHLPPCFPTSGLRGPANRTDVEGREKRVSAQTLARFSLRLGWEGAFLQQGTPKAWEQLWGKEIGKPPRKLPWLLPPAKFVWVDFSTIRG